MSENPNEEMYRRESERRARIRQWLEAGSPKVVAPEPQTAGELPPTMTQLENDLAMLAATGASAPTG